MLESMQSTDSLMLPMLFPHALMGRPVGHGTGKKKYFLSNVTLGAFCAG